jgi:pimeloyl-ACP methyl ester carboxylesterase
MTVCEPRAGRHRTAARKRYTQRSMEIISSSIDEPIAADRQSRIHVLPDGGRIGYAEYGDPRGLPVLALHGTPGSRLMFALADADARDRGLRLIAPERPGYGLSDRRHWETLHGAAEDIRILADALGFDRFAVVGVSGGGPYGIAAAESMPERVLLLALVGPVGPIADYGSKMRMSRMHRLIFGPLARSPFARSLFFFGLRRLLRTAPEAAYRGLMARVPPSDRDILAGQDVKANLRAAVREGLRTGIEGAVQDVRLFSAPWRLSLAHIDVPAVLWQGSDDSVVPPDAAYWLARTLPNCRLDVIQGAGHYWVFGQFGLVLDAVAAALRG